ncbi:MAG: anti-sigma factor [Pseudonocardiaceae bacterium]|nr:anti-sigma factor [Pseudonocardiaceae bacterium]
MTDPFASYDGAYVLGALSPEDRHAFEQHLRECPTCSASVRELAGMPGLLSQVDGFETSEVPEPDLLPSLLSQVRRSRRRRWLVTGASAAAAVATCLALLFTVGDPDEATAGVGRVAMTTVGQAPVSGAVAINDAGGRITKVDMTCRYWGGGGGDYLLVAVRGDGSEETLATWYAVSDDTAQISLGTELRNTDIRALEVRLPDGTPVLRLRRS